MAKNLQNTKFSRAFIKATAQDKISAIAVPFENESHVITPRSWNGKRIWCLTQAAFDDLRGKRNSAT